MRTDIFKEEVSKLGFMCRETTEEILIYTTEIDDKNVKSWGSMIMSATKKEVMSFNTNTAEFRSLPDKEKKLLFNLIYDYASTPVSERFKNTFYAEFLFAEELNIGSERFLNIKRDDETISFMLSTKSQTRGWKSVFTLDEFNYLVPVKMKSLFK